MEFRYNGATIKKSVKWVENNQAEAIGKYRLEYLFVADRNQLERFIKSIDRRIYPKTDVRNPDNPAYELRHIRHFRGDVFASMDMKDLEADVKAPVKTPAKVKTANQ